MDNINTKDRLEQTVLAATHEKMDYIMSCFKRDFPSYSQVGENVDITYEQVMEFVSRSKHMQGWFFNIMTVFRLTYEMPQIAREKISVDKFNKVKETCRKYAQSLENEGRKISEMAKQFNSQVKKIQEEGNKYRESLQGDVLVKILTFTPDQMPFEEHFKIIKFNPDTNDVKLHDSDSDVIKDKAVFQKKIFNDYIGKLLDSYNNGDNLDDYFKDLGKYSAGKG